MSKIDKNFKINGVKKEESIEIAIVNSLINSENPSKTECKEEESKTSSSYLDIWFFYFL